MTPNRLRQLEAKIKGQPRQEALMRQRKLFSRTQEEVQRHFSDVQDVLARAQAMRAIRNDTQLLLDAEQRRLNTVRVRARDIRTLLAKPDCESKDVSEKLEGIKRACAALSEDVTGSWRQFSDECNSQVGAFRSLAQRLSPGLTQRIETLERLVQGAEPPREPEAVQALVSAREAFQQDVQSLKIDGPVESFLRDAQAGQGNPKALLDPAVQQYLNEHPQLWNLLRVVLA